MATLIQPESDGSFARPRFLRHTGALSNVSNSRCGPPPKAKSRGNARNPAEVSIGPSWKVSWVEPTPRRDLRSTLAFTIDPVDAVDLDDALSFEKLSERVFRVGVHIADVACFVQPNTSVDKEAQKRFRSTYISGKKQCLLPRNFSQACSLAPGIDRLAVSILWEIDSEGNILRRWIGRSVIFSSCKLSYDDVQCLINNGFDPHNMNGNTTPQVYGKFQWTHVVSSLKLFYNISKQLKKMNMVRYFTHDQNLDTTFFFGGGSFRNEASVLVEELMLLANRVVAEVISSAFPDSALLRRQPGPNLRMLGKLEKIVGMEVNASSSDLLLLSLSEIKKKLKDNAALLDVLNTYASKMMQPAIYFCTGDLNQRFFEWQHYTLAELFVTHFTSPIRRYPDIVVQRTLCAVIYAEEILMKRSSMRSLQCFTGRFFDKKMAESKEGKEALSEAAAKFQLPGAEELGELAKYCNAKQSATRMQKR